MPIYVPPTSLFRHLAEEAGGPFLDPEWPTLLGTTVYILREKNGSRCSTPNENKEANKRATTSINNLSTEAEKKQRFSVLLGQHTRGFGKGRWGGISGKVEPSDHSLKSVVLREIQEESEMKCSEAQYCGVIYYHLPVATTTSSSTLEERGEENSKAKKEESHDNKQKVEDKEKKLPTSPLPPPPILLELHIFRAWKKDCQGEPKASDEMNPWQWYSIDEGKDDTHSSLPLDKMWKDNSLRLPNFLRSEIQESSRCFCAANNEKSAGEDAQKEHDDDDDVEKGHIALFAGYYSFDESWSNIVSSKQVQHIDAAQFQDAFLPTGQRPIAPTWNEKERNVKD